MDHTMTERLHYTTQFRAIGEPISVDVVMIQQRPDDHDWVSQALESVMAQRYAHLGLITVDNRDRSATIGACWNAAVKKSTADLVLMFGDDDAMTPDLVSCMVAGWQHMAPAAPNLVHLTTHCTIIDQNASLQAHAQVQHTGMFLRKFLLEHPFDEQAQRHVGALKVQAIAQAQQAMQQPMTMAILHHYGYIYRQHPFMVSGRPIDLRQR